MTEQTSILRAESFLRKLPAAYVERLAGMTRHISVPAGYRLFDEEMPASRFWLIDAGQVALDALVPGVGRVVIERLGRGDVVGLSWLVPPYQSTYGAVCTQPLQAYEFDALAVLAACSEDPALGYAILDRFLIVAAHRLQATRTRLMQARPAASGDPAGRSGLPGS